jgi:hypothetical protein
MSLINFDNWHSTVFKDIYLLGNIRIFWLTFKWEQLLTCNITVCKLFANRRGIISIWAPKCKDIPLITPSTYCDVHAVGQQSQQWECLFTTVARQRTWPNSKNSHVPRLYNWWHSWSRSQLVKSVEWVISRRERISPEDQSRGTRELRKQQRWEVTTGETAPGLRRLVCVCVLQ